MLHLPLTCRSQKVQSFALVEASVTVVATIDDTTTASKYRLTVTVGCSSVSSLLVNSCQEMTRRTPQKGL